MTTENQTENLEEEIVKNEAQQEVAEESQTSVAPEHEDGEWFILQCFSGYEYKVQARVQLLIDNPEYKNVIYRVLVPEEETVEIKNNKRVEKINKIFPGYVFVQMKFDEKACFEVRQIPGVSKFIGSKNAPTPVSDVEILKVLRKVGDSTKRRLDIDFEKGEVVKIIDGPFRGYTGPISEINVDKGTLKAMISIFGRETPVELEFEQVEKIVA